MLIDSHCHILKNEYDNIKEIKENAFSSGVKYIINNAYSMESTRELVNTKLYNNEFIAIGVGPEDVNNYTDLDIIEIESYIKNKKVVAIGEIGLDYYWTK